MSFALFSLFAISLLAPTAYAQPAADGPSPKFTGELVSKTPYQVKFHPPAKNHFNQEAPPKVEMINGTETIAGKIDKKLLLVAVDFPQVKKLAPGCVLKTQLVVCDDANTYCMPVREEFDCEKLTLKN